MVSSSGGVDLDMELDGERDGDMRVSGLRGDSPAYGLGGRLFNAAARLATVALPLALLLAMSVPGARAAQETAPLRLLALGDSLTAGYGLAPQDGFTAQLERALTKAGMRVKVLNAGVSGDTTAGGLARLDWALGERPDAVLVELGANDMLRALDPAAARANLDAILKQLAERKLPVLLAGMYASPSLGAAYTGPFNAIYPELAAAHGVALYPFFLDGVATDPELNQPDGIHPNARGVAVIVERIVPYVRALLETVPRSGG